MGCVQRGDRNQVVLLPITLDDYVGGDNEAGTIDAFINSLDISLITYFLKPRPKRCLDCVRIRSSWAQGPALPLYCKLGGKNIQFNPHIHIVVTSGGLTPDGKWRNSKKKFSLSVRVLSAKFWGKFMAFSSSNQELIDSCYKKLDALLQAAL